MTQHLFGLLILAGCHTTFTAAVLIPEPTSSPAAPNLMRRVECPPNMFQCPTSLGAVFSDICCSTGQTCAVDNNNNPACCPSGAICTGTAPTGNPTAVPTQPVSYVPNSYFSFPYAATSFDNSAACASAVTACSENFDICTANLGGRGQGAFGVTIQVPGGGGVTVGGSAQSLGPSATSICSSLSSEACSALETTQCSTLSGGSGTARLQSTPGVKGAVVAAAWAVGILIS